MESIEVAPQVWYVADWLSEADSERLLMKIDGGRWTELSALAGRRLQMHGGTPPPAPQPMLRTPLPDWLAALATRLRDQGRVPSVANHVLINEYLPEQGILPHEDGPLYEGSVQGRVCGTETHRLDRPLCHCVAAEPIAAPLLLQARRR